MFDYHVDVLNLERVAVIQPGLRGCPKCMQAKINSRTPRMNFFVNCNTRVKNFDHASVLGLSCVSLRLWSVATIDLVNQVNNHC